MEVLFSKTLRQTDVGVRLSFPAKVFKECFEFPEGKDKLEFQVTDESSGKSLKFGLSRRSKARHPHPKPVLSSGWLAYVKNKGLKINDRIILYREINNDKTMKIINRFRIRAQRKSSKPFKLFGQDIELWDDIVDYTS